MQTKHKEVLNGRWGVDPLSFFSPLILPERNKEGPYDVVDWSLGPTMALLYMYAEC